MAYNWKSIDGNFPVFTGKESPTQQIRALHDYLFQMREALQFSLNNLSADNFNAEALKNLSDSQNEEVAEQLNKIAELFSGLSEEVGRLRGSIQDITGLSKRIGDLENEITGGNGLKEKVSALDETVNGEDGLETMVAGLSDLIDGLQMQIDNANSQLKMIAMALGVQEDGSVILGAPGQRIDLIGEIYINGVLYSQGEMQ